jgi:hypothetical protein
MSQHKTTIKTPRHVGNDAIDRGISSTSMNSSVLSSNDLQTEPSVGRSLEREDELPAPRVSRWALQLSANNPRKPPEQARHRKSSVRKPLGWVLLAGGAGIAAYVLATKSRLRHLFA